MGVSLNGLTPGATYPGLLKTTDNIDVSLGEKTISDGLGNDTPLSLSTTKVNVNSDLHVGATLKLLLRDTVSGAEVRADVGDLFIGTNAADPVDLYTDDTLRMRITDTGLVGIGFPFAANPLHLFDVNGDARVVGHIYDSSNNQGTSGQVLVKTASGQLWQAPSGGIGGSGTVSNITMWTGASAVGDMPGFSHGEITLSGSAFNILQFGDNDYHIGAFGNNTTTYTESLSIGKDNYTTSLSNWNAGTSNIAIGFERLGFGAGTKSAISIGNGVSLNSGGFQADYTIAIGYQTMGDFNPSSLFNGNNAIGIGRQALYGSGGTQSNVIAIGSSAGYESDGGNGTVMIGGSAGYQSDGDNAILIGTQAGQGSTISNTIMMGLQNGITHDATDCIFIGGFSAGTQPDTAPSQECIVIGQYANLAGGANEIVIGSGLFLSPMVGNGSNTTTIGTSSTTDTYLAGNLHYTGGIFDTAGPSLGTAGQVLSSTGTGTQWINASGTGTVTSVDVSGGTTGLTTTGGPIVGAGTITLGGSLVAANGGTGQTTYAHGDILYGNALGGLSKLPAGTAGEVLSTNGSTADPSWIAVGGTGTVTSVDVSGGTTGLTFTGGPINTAGTITAGGTLGYANGGTGTSVTNLAELQDHLGLKAAYAHAKWTGLTNPYFNFTPGTLTIIPFDTAATPSFTKGTAAGIGTQFTSATDTSFKINDEGVYKVTLRLHFYDQTGDMDIVAGIYENAGPTLIKGLIDDKSVESADDKMFTTVTNVELSSSVSYDIRVQFTGPTNPYPSDANGMECEVIIESVSLA